MIYTYLFFFFKKKVADKQILCLVAPFFLKKIKIHTFIPSPTICIFFPEYFLFKNFLLTKQYKHLLVAKNTFTIGQGFHIQGKLKTKVRLEEKEETSVKLFFCHVCQSV